MRLGIVGNVHDDSAVNVIQRVIELLKGEEVILEKETGQKLGMAGEELNRIHADAIITIGGDGTILRALQVSSLPVFTVNVGILGFLAEVDVEDLDEGIKGLLSKEYVIDERKKLRTSLNGKRLADCTNEAVIHTADVAKIREFDIEVNGQLAESIRADGLIVATPTGSTCYAMSVGAPILDPRVEAIVIAPIAPFKMSARPIVVPSKSHVLITMQKPKECTLVLDGQHQYTVKGGDVLEFTASEKVARFIRFGENFYEKLAKKLKT